MRHKIGLVLIVASMLLGVHTWVGHWHRYPFEIQSASWNDGVSDYTFTRAPTDTFSIEHYEEVNSVATAIEFIQERYPLGSQFEIMNAVYDFTRKRYMHFMYPHHTFLTNPYLWLGEKLLPSKPLDGMFLAEMNLRHAAYAPCGGAAVTFIEIYRAMGGRAQFGSFIGHDIAEVDIDGDKYIVDANLETIIPHSLAEVSKQPDLIMPYYSHRPDRISYYLEVFSTTLKEAGYDRPPSYRADVYWLQKLVDVGKWFVPPIVALIGIFFFAVRKRESIPSIDASLEPSSTTKILG